MKATAEIQAIPIGAGVSVRREVQRAHELLMVFKLMETASKGWRSLNGKPLLAEVVKGTVFIDGIKEKPAA